MTTRKVVRIETSAITHLGYAFGRDAGRPVFASYALPGETVDVQLKRDRDDHAIGYAVAIEIPSPDRVTPPCPLFHPEGCGGCQWQHADYPAQLRYKEAIVHEQLERIGRLPAPPVRPTLPSPDPFAYRTHATLNVTLNGELAFVAPDGVGLRPVMECLLLRPELQALLYRLRRLDFRIAERVRLQVGSDPANLALIAYGQLRHRARLSAQLPDVSLIEMNGDHAQALQGNTHLEYTIAGRRYRVTAGGFFQVNLAQAERLVETVQALLPEHLSHALDLYSGVGLFTALLAERSAQVTSVESYKPAVNDAQHNLARVCHAKLLAGEVEVVLPRLADPVDVVITDPPRAGMKRSAVEALAHLAPAQIIYISCEPSTLARDLRLLVDAGYTLASVQPIDMFPQTYHVETVVNLTRVAS